MIFKVQSLRDLQFRELQFFLFNIGWNSQVFCLIIWLFFLSYPVL